MNVEEEINSLAAETLAYSIVLQSILSRLASDRTLRFSIKEGFDQAVEVASSVAIQTGRSASPDQTTKCIRIIEELRAAVLGPDSGPKHFV